MNLIRLFGRPPDAPPPRFPEGRIGYAVGDIHGRADLLELMLAKLESMLEEGREGPPPLLIFLGDYVDRGPESPRVLDLLMSDRPIGFERRYLKGNHEQAMLDFMADPLENLSWVSFGGLETMLSYGVKPPPLSAGSADDWIFAAAELRASVPKPHIAFLNTLERYVEVDEYLFVHAGVDAGKPLEEQTDDDLFWIRDRFTKSARPFSHRVVHGHTITAAPHVDERRIGVDTGAYASGVLTAARFEGETVSFLTAEEPGRAQARG